MVKYCYRKAVNKMGKIIALVNQKGGVGKTTTSINLSASLGVLGKKVLLVDLDPQGNSTTGVGVDKGSKNKSIYDLLIDNATINEVIVKTKFKNLYIIPATINLAGANIELMEKSSLDPNFNKVGQLKKYLEQGEIGLENKKKPGNPLIKYSRRKELTQIEQLEYENMKLRIENERLKKGYILKGDGSAVIFK